MDFSILRKIVQYESTESKITEFGLEFAEKLRKKIDHKNR